LIAVVGQVEKQSPCDEQEHRDHSADCVCALKFVSVVTQHFPHVCQTLLVDQCDGKAEDYRDVRKNQENQVDVLGKTTIDVKKFGGIEYPKDQNQMHY
jgi:hypothetical protein